MAGIAVGGLTVVVWSRISGGWFDLYEIVPGFVLAGAAMILVSLISPAPGEEIRREFDEVAADRG